MTATCASKSTARVVDNIYHGPVFVLCEECGPNYPVDEDGCCLMCGSDAFTFANECSTFGAENGCSQ